MSKTSKELLQEVHSMLAVASGESEELGNGGI